jgi:hypothetical protein
MAAYPLCQPGHAPGRTGAEFVAESLTTRLSERVGVEGGRAPSPNSPFVPVSDLRGGFFHRDVDTLHANAKSRGDVGSNLYDPLPRMIEHLVKILSANPFSVVQLAPDQRL